jgi:uncharacterized membrane protein
VFKRRLVSYRGAGVNNLTTDEFWELLQLGITFIAFVAVIVIFVYLAYEKPSA